MFDALQKGLHLEILDENDNFALAWSKYVEYVKNGNMTSKDNYVIPLAMAIKTVTKKILLQLTFLFRLEQSFLLLKKDCRHPLIKDRQIVVDPKSTNFGLGISIFQEPASLKLIARLFRDRFFRRRRCLGGGIYRWILS